MRVRRVRVRVRLMCVCASVRQGECVCKCVCVCGGSVTSDVFGLFGHSGMVIVCVDVQV